MTNTRPEDILSRCGSPKLLRAEVRRIDANTAERLLELNTRNYRKLRNNYVDQYARAMERGEWQNNGGMIAFHRDGWLVDGQHRLSAIVKTGKSTNLVVVYGVTSDLEVDNQKRRSLSDHLARRGEKNISNLAAAVRIAIRADNGEHMVTVAKGSNNTISQPEVFAWIDKNPEIRYCVEVVCKARTPKGIAKSLITWLYFEAYRADMVVTADRFLEQLSGINVPSDSPVATLTARLIAEDQKASTLPRPIQLAFLIKTWNAFVQGRIMQRVSWVPSREDYPTMVLEETEL
jgi:hypothetical protein